MASISLCMIVRNEEKHIEECLQSAIEYVDEIIVVDTGSEDGTKDICSKYEVKIFDFQWEQNFASARNFCIEQASGDWILWMDADERLVVNDHEALLQCLSKKEKQEENFISVGMKHFYGEIPADEKRVHVSHVYRLFRNGKGIRFVGRIHERPVSDDRKEEQKAEENKFIEILHYGYMDEAVSLKSGRNKKMLLREWEDNQEDGWICYHLAVEYYHEQNYTTAYDFTNLAILLFIKKGLLPPSLFYKLKYDILITLEDYTTVAESIEKAIMLYPDYVDLHFYKGMAEFSIGEFHTARETFLYCIVLGESNPEYLILRGMGSFMAEDYIERCNNILEGEGPE